MPREEQTIVESITNICLAFAVVAFPEQFLHVPTHTYFSIDLGFMNLSILPSKLTLSFCSTLQQGVPQAINTLFCVCGARHLLSYLLKELPAVDLVPPCRNSGRIVEVELFLEKEKKSLLSFLLNLCNCCITLPRVLLLLLGHSVLDCCHFLTQSLGFQAW